MEKRWHGSVGFKLTDRNGVHCGYVGLAYPCESQADGYAKGLAWARKHGQSKHFAFLVHTFELEVRYY